MFRKSWQWANQYGSFKRKRKSYECTHELINMNDIMSHNFKIVIILTFFFVFIPLQGFPTISRSDYKFKNTTLFLIKNFMMAKAFLDYFLRFIDSQLDFKD
jgi:hypothetical protein